ncbi:DNA polymerase III catalytic subunit, PolC type [Dethiosulfatibacter aminovorans DSM 17477]|uniref:DNA polymerase III PolC-type n=1 Tax=Dethiosulfatibacter aminovorans DSM 17477 TaxID=1121476 RepID=A0A1M6DDS7_9FIRM|nr:PolC-type DNA polymerase III [Dethiosulfatibacter aminovorans]SHI71457.1 DNA polymerase III catalytic subunit, PolC type [Dethiosulfatibacter aminovorans DSM 17477]
MSENLLINDLISNIELDHSSSRMKIVLGTERIFDLASLYEYEREYRRMFSDGIAVKVAYGSKIEGIPDNIVKSNICFLFKKYIKSFSREFSEENIQVEGDSVIVNINSKLLFDNLMRSNTADKISGYNEKVYGCKYNIIINLVKNNGQDLDLDKELDEIVKKTSEINSVQQSKKAKQQPVKQGNEKVSGENVILGKNIKDSFIKIDDVMDVEGFDCCLRGKILSIEVKAIKKDLFISQIDITDYTNSITVKSFIRKADAVERVESLGKGSTILVKGRMNYDTYSKEYVLIANSICMCSMDSEGKGICQDTSSEKRVELHVHSKMSSMDGISDFGDIVKRAKEWGHKAIAITDHGVLQCFPDAMHAADKHGLKILYGVEGYLSDDDVTIVKNPVNQGIREEMVVFDIETTGLSPIKDMIIEIGAVKVVGNEITEEFNILVNPGMDIPENIIELTGIRNEDVKDCEDIYYCIEEFMKFIGDCKVLVAHNANFDYSFIRKYLKGDFSILDTLELSRILLKKRRSHKLNKICEHFKISLENHHRASDDARATGEILIRFIEMLEERKISNLTDVNSGLSTETSIKDSQTYHIIILAKNYVGLKNLYKIVSEAHINYFYKKPRIPKSLISKYREGLILGTACEAGELFKAVMSGSTDAEIDEIVSMYDFVEIQPVMNNMFLVNKGILKSREDLVEINKKLVEIGKRNDKIICATGDVHFLDEDDSQTREILMSGQGFSDASDQPPLYFKSTDEMLKEFSYLGEELCREVVITGPNLVADSIEDGIKPIPDGTFPPIIEGSDEMLKEITHKTAYEKYGNPLPEIVEQRLNRELNSIISNGYAIMYIISQKLVEKSLQLGYLVGSRGSVGSSFAATMSNITEVNPLPPHYICRNCKNSEFILDGTYGSGVDMPSKKCPVCGGEYEKEGHDIPFEVFLGFKGDKEPDIDLNFAAVAQIAAMKNTEELFGEGFVYRAGTIGTIASKTAYGFVKNYFDEKGMKLRNAEINRLVDNCTGIKRTTGQHPGGVMIVPKNKEIYDFTPIQYPANNKKSGTITTHFDYHSISGRILKLDLLGHDTPTIIRMLEDFTGVSNYDVPLDDPETISLFESPEALGVTKEDIKCETGTLGIPEFGTHFVRQMLLDTKPRTFSDLVRISGLSHGTDVWINNAQELVKKNITTISNVISTRDDIMTYLIYQGLEKKRSFDIMERVRKGKGLRDEDLEAMHEQNVPQWYIDSCNKIKYMFPKAHAVAYVTMSVKIAYFKVHHPLAFYGSYFTMKAQDFDADLVVKGEKAIEDTLNEISKKESNTQKEKNLCTVLEVALEMYKRGYSILPVDLYKSDYKEFKIEDNKLLPPFISIQGLGESAALSIQEEREKGEFISIEDLSKRARVNKTCIEILKNHGTLEGLNQSNQISLFNI